MKKSNRPEIKDFIEKWDDVAEKAAKDAGGELGDRLLKRGGKWLIKRIPVVTQSVLYVTGMKVAFATPHGKHNRFLCQIPGNPNRGDCR